MIHNNSNLDDDISRNIHNTNNNYLSNSDSAGLNNRDGNSDKNRSRNEFLEDPDKEADSSMVRRRKGGSISAKFYGETESQQYEQDEIDAFKRHQYERHYEDKDRWWSFSQKAEVWRWTLTFITGVVCGIVAMLVTSGTQILSRYKFDYFYDIIEKEKLGNAAKGSAFLFLLACNLSLGFLAWVTVFAEPLAAGSGIPEVKCFLNGLNIPRVVNLKTLLCKTVGMVFSCASGLPLGKEGPMIHVGAGVAAEVSQGLSSVFGCFSTSDTFVQNQDFRNDKEKRDFVACGAAAGVAAAFGSPIGGVLFSLEEGSSFWSTKLTWRCFFCAMTTVFTIFIIVSARTYFGHSDNTAMFSFGEFFSLKGEKSNYAVWELFLFLYVGCLGGLIGATFNKVNTLIFKWRSARSCTNCMPCVKLIEVLIVTASMTGVSYFIPYLFGTTCTPLPVDMEEWSEQEKRLVDQLVPFYCPKGSHYNELASLFLTESDVAIKQLFHFREIGDHNDSTFSSYALFTFFASYIAMACITNGIAVPAGMFVPSLLSGAAFGRLTGHLLHKLDRTRGTFADSGTYALMGAAACTSGITRMTISLTVMILEGTGDMQYVLPLMLTVMSARLVGNVFTEGLYDIHIHNRDLNFLDEDDSTQLSDLYDVSTSAIMTRKPICFPPVIRVGDAFDILSKCSHHCFPIVLQKKGGIFGGTITRKAISSLLKKKAFGRPVRNDGLFEGDANYSRTATGGDGGEYSDELPEISDDTPILSPQVSWEYLECDYPVYPNISDLTVSETERSAYIDLRPYIDRSAYQLNEYASVQRAYRMFRTLGLRHLIVTDHFNKVIGILTRADLIASHIYKRSALFLNKTYKNLGEKSDHNSSSSSSSPISSTSMSDSGHSSSGGDGNRHSSNPIHSLLSMAKRNSPHSKSSPNSPSYVSLQMVDSAESLDESDQIELLDQRSS